MSTFDAAIIGSGPAGISAALYLARSGCSVILFENLAAGGQILQTDILENYPGFPKGIKGYELADLLAAHIENLTVTRSRDTVESVSGHAGAFTVVAGESKYLCRTVVVCTGAAHRPLGIEGEDRLQGRGVSYCALCDGNFYRNQPVAVVGGGNSALEESLYLSKIASKVYLIHRRDSFRGAQVYQDKIASLSDRIEPVLNSAVEKLEADLIAGLTGVVVRHLVTGEHRTLKVNGLFVYVGMEPRTAFLPHEVDRDARGFIITDTEMRTSVPGIFAAGDVRSKLCRQAVTAAGDGATAAQAAFVLMEQLHA